MDSFLLDRETVLAHSAELPVFPRVVHEILATIDDPDANLKVLSGYIQQDPVASARVISLANAAAIRSGRHDSIGNVFAAISMIGMSRVRELALMSVMTDFMNRIEPGVDRAFWEHSVIVGVCAEELAMFCNQRISSSEALVAGLLHDVGQLWLMRFERQASGAAWISALLKNIPVDVAEHARFGAGHPEIGAWLAEDWRLPQAVVGAIRGHHAPAGEIPEGLSAIVHVAEVLSNGLDLAGREENRVSYLSAGACARLGIVWDRTVRPLFGRMEGRARHAAAFFQIKASDAVRPPEAGQGGGLHAA